MYCYLIGLFRKGNLSHILWRQNLMLICLSDIRPFFCCSFSLQCTRLGQVDTGGKLLTIQSLSLLHIAEMIQHKRQASIYMVSGTIAGVTRTLMNTVKSCIIERLQIFFCVDSQRLFYKWVYKAAKVLDECFFNLDRLPA